MNSSRVVIYLTRKVVYCFISINNKLISVYLVAQSNLSIRKQTSMPFNIIRTQFGVQKNLIIYIYFLDPDNPDKILTVSQLLSKIYF